MPDGVKERTETPTSEHEIRGRHRQPPTRGKDSAPPSSQARSGSDRSTKFIRHGCWRDLLDASEGRVSAVPVAPIAVHGTIDHPVDLGISPRVETSEVSTPHDPNRWSAQSRRYVQGSSVSGKHDVCTPQTLDHLSDGRLAR